MDVEFKTVNKENYDDKSSKKPQHYPASFKGIIIQWLSSLNAYGIPKIFRSNLNSILKIIWACCFFISLGYCLYLLVQLIQNYVGYSSYINTQIYQDTAAKFPAVSFCNLKSVNISVNTSLFSQVAPAKNFQSIFDWLKTQQYNLKGIVYAETNTTIRKSYGYQLENMLISCYFNYNPCNVSSFTYYYDPSLGNCYTFNKGLYDNGTLYPINNVTIPGLAYGLTLELFLGNPPNETVYEYNDGVIVSINNQTSLPFTEGDIMKAAAGEETDLIVRRNFINKLPSPYGNCLKDTTINSSFSSVFFDYIVNTLGYVYSQKYCYSLCIQNQIMNSCSCASLNLPMFMNTTKICNQQFQTICAATIVKNFDATNESKNCQNKCPYKCDTIDYGVTSYRALYPTNYYTQLLYNYSMSKGLNVAYNNIEKSFAKINVYYNSMEYTKTQQTISMDPSTLFSNIFGTINFCLGMNIFTVVEIFELLVFLIALFISFLSSRNRGLTV